MTFPKTSFLLLLSSLLASGLSKEEEVADILSDAVEWGEKQRSVENFRNFSKEHREKLEAFSDEEFIKGMILKMEYYDQDEKTKMKAYVGSAETVMLMKHHDLVSDLTYLRKQVALEKDPRRFRHLVLIANSFTKARKADFIPEYFNSLFRDGPVSIDQGSITPKYADDVSKLAYQWIIGSLELFEADYSPPEAGGNRLASHGEEVDHLAQWLIENWPGCENYELSDQNTPEILEKDLMNRKRVRKTSDEIVPVSDEKNQFVFSWPMILALLFLVSSLGYLGFKKFSNRMT
jgi:hypothetical protein